jgi:hypothetical protein
MRLFGMDEFPFDLSLYSTSAPPNDHSKTMSSKIISRNKNAPTMKHANNYMFSLTLKGHLCKVTMIPHPGFGCIIILLPLILEFHRKFNNT